MRSKITWFILMSTLHLLIAGSLFASGFSIYAQGARAMAMAGAFTGNARDISAIFYNPAGLAYIPGSRVQIGVSALNHRSLFEFFPVFGVPSSTDMDDKWIAPPTLYLSTSVTTKISAGFGLYSPFGYGVQWSDDWPGSQFATESNLTTYSFNPVAAYRVNDLLSIAAGFQYITAAYDVERIPSETGLKTRADVSGSGSGITGGVLYRATEMISLGLSFRSPVKLDLDGDITTNPEVVPGSSVTSEIELPASLSVGINYIPKEELSVEADIIWVGWSSIDKIAMKSDNSVVLYESMKNFEDKLQLRLGLEYTTPTNVSFRTGYFYAQSPAPDEFADPTFPDTVHEGATFGLGWETDRMTIDAAYVHSFKRDRLTDKTNLEIGTGKLAGRYVNKSDGISISIGYRIN